MMALRSLKCIRFSSRFPKFHSWEQVLRVIAEMKLPPKFLKWVLNIVEKRFITVYFYICVSVYS